MECTKNSLLFLHLAVFLKQLLKLRFYHIFDILAQFDILFQLNARTHIGIGSLIQVYWLQIAWITGNSSIFLLFIPFALFLLTFLNEFFFRDLIEFATRSTRLLFA